jgi:KDO2-lipid IV(A) lauroyltransferase
MFVNNLAMSRVGSAIALNLLRFIPRKLAYFLGFLIIKRMARNTDAPLIHGIRTNQAVVRDLPYDDPALNEAVIEVLKTTVISLVDSMKAVAGGEKVVRRSFIIGEDALKEISSYLEAGRGLVIVGPHLAGFEMFIFYVGIEGLPILGLSYPDPKGSYTTQNTIRRKFGFNIIPVSLRTLRQSFQHLRDGGIVMTAVDRAGLGGEELEFFGRKTVLPIGHARIAVKTGSPLMVGIPAIDEDGMYHGKIIASFVPDPDADEHSEAISLSQKALNAMEPYIRKWPERWLMYHPVWQDDPSKGKK